MASIIEEEWNRSFLRILPVASLGLGVLSTVMAIMTLQRYGPLGQRVYSQDGTYLVNVRYPGQWHDIREFVQPDNPDIQAIYAEVGPSYWALYDFVCRNIDYGGDIGEFWKFPSEVLQSMRADCEDTAILLISLIRAGGAPNAHVVLGEYQGYGHAWAVQNGFIYETTYTRAMPVTDPEDYCPYCLFNEQDVIELWPGAMGEVFELQRKEAAKLNLMARALETNHA